MLLESASTKALGDVAAINAEEVKYRNAKAKFEQFGDVADLKVFQSRRDAAVQSNIDDLSRKLSQRSWTGLHSFINDTFRNQLHMLANPSVVAKK